MANLTRIKNNQITDSTIQANTKIVPGSIVGTLFNSNITTTSNFTITGNLTVQGSATYVTIASTNTYVNDPLIVLNNGFAGTNTYDIGMLFNRGTSSGGATAITWNESAQEFRLTYTTETGTTFGGIAVTSFANLHVGNVSVDYLGQFGNISVVGNVNTTTGGMSIARDLAVNGGNITTSASTFNLINTTASTLNFGSFVATGNIGAGSGTMTINNPTLVGQQPTQNLYNTLATTMNFAGAATTITIGAASGTANIRNANIYLPNVTTLYSGQATVSLFDQPTTVTGYNSATTLSIGATTGTANIRNANVYFPNASTFYAGQATVSLLEQPATINAFTAATTANIGAGSGTLTINNPTLVGQQPTQNLYNTLATTMNFAGAATTLTIGAASGTANIRNANVYFPNATTLYSGLATVSLFDQPATVTAFNAATTVTIGATTGTANIRNANVYLPNATTLYSGQATVSLLAQPTSITAFTAATTANIGAGSGTLTINNPTVVGQQATQNLYNTLATTMNFAGAATTLTIGATTGTANIQNANVYFPNATTLYSGQPTVSLLDQPATVTAFNAATTLTIGATTGTANIRNANVYFPNATTIFSGQTSLTIANTVTTSLSIGGAASTFNLGTPNGAGLTNILGNATVQSALNSTAFNNGALTIAGGLGVAKDVYIQGNLYVANIIATTQSILTVTDSLLYLSAVGNESTYTPYNYDIGLFSHFWGGQANVYSHTGFVRNDADGIWYLFSNIAEPLNGQINLTNAVYDQLTLGNILLKTSTGIATDQTTISVVDTTATTVNFAGTATNLTIGSTTGTANIRNANVYFPNATTLYSGQTTVSLLDQPATVTAFNAATTVTIGATTGTANIRNANVYFPNASTFYAGQATVSLLAQPTSITAFTAATTANIGAGTGTLTINNPTVVGQQPTQNLYNTVATTMNFAQAATTITIGAATGTVNIQNANVYFPNATEFYSGQTTVNFLTEVPTTVNAFGAATTITIGAASGTANIRNANVYFPNATTLYSGQATVSLLAQPTSITAFTAATTANIGAGTGTLTINNPTVVGQQATQNLYNTIATTMNFAQAASVLNMGASTGTATISNAILSLPFATNISVSQPSVTVANTVATTVNAFGSATTLNFAASTGATVIRNATTSLGQLYANSGIVSTGTTTGALVVTGGVGISSNIWVANGAVINSSQTSDNFTVKGVNATSLIYANSNRGAVVIGGSNVAIHPGATLKVNSTDSFIVPVGTTGQRPSLQGNVDTAGMVRFNTSISTLEYYDGSAWQGTQGSFTVIASEQFNGDNTTNVFVLSTNMTSDGVLVCINGIVQTPTLAYGISGNVLTLSEAPVVGDLIDVRKISTTTTVSLVQVGFSYFQVDAYTANIATGTGSSTIKNRIAVDSGGNIGIVNGSKLTYDQLGITVGTGAVTVDTFDLTKYRAAKYIATTQSYDATAYEITEILVVHNGVSAMITEYGKISTSNSILATFSVAVSGNAVTLLATGIAGTTNNVKVMSTYITV